MGFATSGGISTGGTTETVRWRAARAAVIEAVEATDKNRAIAVEICWCAVGASDDSFYHLRLQAGIPDWSGAPLCWSGRLSVGAGDEIRAIFYNTVAADILKLDVKARPV
jgi:hypothetical protein